MMALSGVRSSCDMLARNSDLWRLAASIWLALVLDLAEQPGVLDRQHRLGGEGFQKLDDFGAKLAGRFSPHHQAADDAVFA